MTTELSYLTARQKVELALDRYVQQPDADLTSVRAGELATLIGEPTREMSTWLQQYRVQQQRVTRAGDTIARRVRTRYIIACYEYGRYARWRILAKPGDSPVVLRAAWFDQFVHVITDAVRRCIDDQLREVEPKLREHVDPHDERLVRMAMEEMKQSLDRMESSIAFSMDLLRLATQNEKTEDELLERLSS